MLEENLTQCTDNLKGMERPCSQQERFSRHILHIGCFPSAVKSLRSMVWHSSVGFSELQCTSCIFSPEVLMLQCSHQISRRRRLSVISLCGHTQTWILEYLKRLQHKRTSTCTE